MCNPALMITAGVGGALVSLINGSLWYAEGKDIEIRNVGEIRFGLTLIVGIPGLLVSLCTNGIL